MELYQNITANGINASKFNGLNSSIPIKDENEEDDDSGIISDDISYWFILATYVILSALISFLGSIGNIINIIVFTKQGFKDTINISLLCLSISDLGALLSLIWMAMCFSPWSNDKSHPRGFDAIKIQYLTAGWPHVCFARITSFITAFITFERCLCIALPFKVKMIITKRRTVIVNVALFLVMFASVAPVYFATRFAFVFDEDANKTVFSFVYTDNGEFIENVSFAMSVFAQISSFAFVISCTIILLHNLLRSSKWRQNSSVDSSMMARDKKVMKMVIRVALIFIVCFFPSAVNLILMISFNEYSVVGREKNLFLTVWGFLNCLEATNSSVNIFIYYRMSTKYRNQFRSIFCYCRNRYLRRENILDTTTPSAINSSSTATNSTTNSQNPIVDGDGRY